MEGVVNNPKSNVFLNFLRNRPPVLILIICLFELFGLFLLPSAFESEPAVTLGLWYQIYLAFTGILSLAIIYSLWKMKKMGPYIYLGSYALHNIVALIAGNWMIGVLIIPVIGLVFIGFNRKKFK